MMDSEWHVSSPFTPGDVNAVQIADTGSLYAACADGQLVRASFDGPFVTLASVGASLLALDLLADDGIVCCGHRGAVVLYRREGTQVQHVPNQPRLSGVAGDGSGDALLVGSYDEASGVIFRFRGSTSGLSEVLPASQPRGLTAITAVSSETFLIAGQRGYLVMLAAHDQKQIPTGTEHPLRAVCAASPNHWLAGGGGWAQEMPVLLEGNQEQMRPLVSARGDRVIVGIARREDGRAWIAESHSDGSQWHGRVWELRDGELRPDGEFPAQGLRGIACRHGRLAVCGAKGLLAWKRPV